MSTKHLPPQWVNHLLTWFCDPGLLPEIEGDLYEMYQRWVQQHGIRKAQWLYFLNAITYFRPAFVKRNHDQLSPVNHSAMFNNYLKVGYRNLFRHKVFSFINMTGLSIGLACCMLIVLYTKDEVSYDRFHENKEQIFRVTATMTRSDGVNQIGSTNQIVGPSFAKEIPEIEAYLRMETASFILRRGTDTHNQEVHAVEDNFFSVFSFPLLAGNPQQVFSELNTMVLSETAAEKYFGTTDVVGKTLELQVEDAFEPFVITGVAKDPPQNSSIQFDVLIPFKFNRQNDEDTNWIGFYINTFVLLSPDADYHTLDPKLNEVFLSKAGEELKQARERFNFIAEIHFGLQPFQQIHLDPDYGANRNGLTAGSNPIYSYILSGIALFILLIACINFINLTVAHSLRRAKEIGIRKVIGGQRRQLIGQFMGESFIICLIAFAGAILIVLLVLPFFNELANKRLSFTYLLDTKLITGYILLFLLTGFIAGFYPALVLSGFTPVQTLYNRFRLSGKNYLAKGLVVFQFSLAIFLMIATVGVYSQFNYLIQKDLGYNNDDLAVVYLGRGRHDAIVEALKNDLAQEPSIDMISTRSGGPNYTVAKANNKEQEIEFAISWVDENFLPALQIPLMQGRNFSPEYTTDSSQSVIVNESFVKEVGWGGASGKDPIGQELAYGDQPLTVVGVVKDYHFESLREKIGPLLLIKGSGDLWVKMQPDQLTQALKATQAAYEKVVPFRPFEYELLSTINERNYEAEAKWKQMITVGAGLSIFVSCMGLFGLAMLSIQRRTKEIGIRKVLGAAVSDIVFLLSHDFVKLIILAFLIAIPLGYYAVDQWLQNFAYQINLSWWIFALAGTVAIIVAVSTVSVQSVKAATANPVDSLRNE
uniref:ABC transporter permease n=1 Tax=Roseihalotalea indica TaxID=2867963 RepID=A0AA49JJ75_9BACT|nr:ABC transporter permease [Tunicatimonas sp. TK19036]